MYDLGKGSMSVLAGGFRLGVEVQRPKPLSTK